MVVMVSVIIKRVIDPSYGFHALIISLFQYVTQDVSEIISQCHQKSPHQMETLLIIYFMQSRILKLVCLSVFCIFFNS